MGQCFSKKITIVTIGICAICEEKPITHIAIPCGHIFGCEKCSVGLKRCPICRAESPKFYKIYLNRSISDSEITYSTL